METLLLSTSDEDIALAAEMIKNGQVVGIPTETVYGLGADASNEEAVRSVFAAKGRPADNPLIVHLADFSHAVKYTSSIPELAYKLAERFCPGPLTMVLPKNERIPMVTSGGLDTVGIRVPSHKAPHNRAFRLRYRCALCQYVRTSEPYLSRARYARYERQDSCCS